MIRADEAAGKRRSSLADEAYLAIRASIIQGKFPPGTRVTVRPIADELDLSPTPIKAALVALEREGVLESRLHRGFFVPELSLDDVREIHELREALDSVAGRRCAGAFDHADIARTLRGYCDAQRDCIERGDVDGYREHDLEFHRSIWALCGNTRIRRAGEDLVGQMRLGNSVSARRPGRMEASLTEHLAIVDAIAGGDAAAAERAVRTHLARTRETLRQPVPPE
jgi:DNA-binding GntR family transcriptional regulator